MRILFISSFSPYPPNRGDRIRSFYTSKTLMEHFDVDAVYFYRREANQDIEPQSLSARSIRRFCLSRARMIFNGLRAINSKIPNMVRLTYDQEIKKYIEKLLLRNPDLVFIQGIRSAPYIEHYEGPKILDLVDTISMHFERMLRHTHDPFRYLYFLSNKNALHNYERNIIMKFDKSFLSSPADISYLNFVNTSRRIVLLPNGVDYRVFKPPTYINSETRQLFFHGNIKGYNADAVSYFLRRIMPLIMKEEEVTLNLIGYIPPRYVKKWSGQNVKIIGYVDDIAATIRDLNIMVAPHRITSGIQNKVLEAMASGKPVVCTPMVNDAIGGTNEENICVASDEGSFKDYVVRLIRDKNFYNKISTNAREFIIGRYTWDRFTEGILKSIYSL